MSRFLVLTNGHGEDLSGSLLARKLILNGHSVHAFPIVGFGNIYKKEKIKIIGKTRNFNTGGLGYNSLKGRINDLFNGQIIYFLKKLFLIIRIKNNYDYFFVAGDIVPIFFAWLCKKKYFTYLVAYSSHYEGKLVLPWPCKYFLNSKRSLRIFSRDELTSRDLTNQLKKKVIFLGNPFMDKLSISEKNFNSIIEIALFPGSRINELENNLYLMLDLLEYLSTYKYFGKLRYNFALIFDLKIERVQEILQTRNWILQKKSTNSNEVIYVYKSINVKFKWNAFEDILKQCDFAITMAGTASEQAIGLSKPIIQIEGSGPQFTKKFAEAQRRLLGPYVFCHTKYNNKTEQLEGTTNLLLKIIYLIKLDNSFLNRCRKIAKNRIGKNGASQRITADIEKYLNHV